MKDKYFTYCHESGFDTHETIEGAIEDANGRVPDYLQDEWSEDVTGVCVGIITHRATMCDKVERDGSVDEDGYDDEGTYWEPYWKYKCDYKMLPVEQNPAPDVAKLVEALEGLLAITDESLGVSGYHLNGDMAKWCEFDEVDMAKEALSAYRQQGGSK